MKPALLTLALLLHACAASTPATREYLLRDATTAVAAPAGAAEVTLDSVRMAPYLDRAGIVVEVAPLQIVEARYERWAEPLGLALRGLGRLQYRTGFDPAATTYRVDLAREQATRLEEPF